MREKMTSAIKCRKQTFKEVIEYAKSMEVLADVIVRRYDNQGMASIEVNYFFKSCN